MARLARNILASTGLVLVLAVCQAGIDTSKHNLAATGPGTIKAATELQTCVFCHAPHNASAVAPLWNRNNPAGAYIPYTSSSIIMRLISSRSAGVGRTYSSPRAVSASG